MNFRKVRKVAAFSALGLFILALIVLAAAYSRKRAAELRTRDWVVSLLEKRFGSGVELDDFHVDVWPEMKVSGSGLSLRYRNRPEAPPMIRIEQFAFKLGFWSIFRAPHRIEKIHLQRMVMTVPPRQLGNTSAPAAPAEKRKLPDATAAEIDCEDAELLIFSNKPGKDPLDWEIHHLVLTEVGLNQAFFFRGDLTNAKPKGEIRTRGKFGPWNLDDPGSTPVTGNYGFEDADLGPFPGIAGILSSTGDFKGQLDTLEVAGKTDTPNFSLDNVKNPVRLHTDFSATVDGTNGDTLLHPVRALLGQSLIVASGSVINVRERQGHLITLDVTTPKARIEDILKLAVKSDKPFLRGPIDVKARLTIPPGKQQVIDKIGLDGSFSITDGQWTDSEMREKLAGFSRRAEGQSADQSAGSSVTDLRGRFVLQNGVISFSKLTFSVPGANVELAGTYNLVDQAIDMQGHLRMQAKISQVVGGKKAILLKAIDPFFAKNGAGADLPITITGTHDKPVFGVTVFHKKFEKQMGKQSGK